MTNEKTYLISESTYHKHIDEEVQLYGMLHQLAFLAGKVKGREDAARLRDTAIHYGRIADEMFESWNIPGRYLVYGEKDDLEALREMELEPVFDPEDEAAEESLSPRDILEILYSILVNMAEVLDDALKEMDALDGD